MLRGGSAREEGKERGEGGKCEKIGAREVKASLRGLRCRRRRRRRRRRRFFFFLLLLLLLLGLFSFTLYFVARPFARRTCMCEIRGVEASERVCARDKCAHVSRGRKRRKRGEREEKKPDKDKM